MKRNCEASIDLTIATSSEGEDDDDDDASMIFCLLLLTSATRAVAYGLDARGWELLCTWGVPIAFFNILYKLRQQFGTETDLGCLDAFAGAANIWRVFSGRGVSSAAYDCINDADLQNILSPAGFLNLVQWSRRLTPHKAIAHFGVLCSTWVFMSRNATRRRIYNIDGRSSTGEMSQKVQEGNMMASRVALLLLLLMVRNVIWIVEQPNSSLLFFYRRFWQLHQCMRLHKIRTWLGSFGAPTAKAIVLLSTHRLVYTLQRGFKRSRCESNTIQVVIPAISGGVTGGRDLRGTQQYPLQYAEALYRSCMEANFAELNHGCLFDGERALPQTEDTWADAGLKSVCTFLDIPDDRLIVC